MRKDSVKTYETDVKYTCISQFDWHYLDWRRAHYANVKGTCGFVITPDYTYWGHNHTAICKLQYAQA